MICPKSHNESETDRARKRTLICLSVVCSHKTRFSFTEEAHAAEKLGELVHDKLQAAVARLLQYPE